MKDYVQVRSSSISQLPHLRNRYGFYHTNVWQENGSTTLACILLPEYVQIPIRMHGLKRFDEFRLYQVEIISKTPFTVLKWERRQRA